MTKKFDTDDEPEHLRILAEDAEFKRRVVEEHKTGPGVIEPDCYEPALDGKCYCLYCRMSRKKKP